MLVTVVSTIELSKCGILWSPFPLEDSMDEQRKYAILFAATILAARKLAEIGDQAVSSSSQPP